MCFLDEIVGKDKCKEASEIKSIHLNEKATAMLPYNLA